MMVRTQYNARWFFPSGLEGTVVGFNAADTIKKAKAAARATGKNLVHNKDYRLICSIKMVSVPDRGATKEVKV